MSGRFRQTKNSPEVRKNAIRHLAQMFYALSTIYAALWLASGTLTWKWGLIYTALNVLSMAVMALVLPIDVLAERGANKKNIKKWDKILTALISPFPIYGALIVSELDYRYGWSGEPGMLVRAIGILLFVIGSALFIWAMGSNKFFSKLVRIQYDRGHKVETGGPYRIVRHPGYVGYMLGALVGPLILGSWWGLIPSSLIIPVYVIRTALEDATLMRELDGYKDYAKKVRYRLIPGIW